MDDRQSSTDDVHSKGNQVSSRAGQVARFCELASSLYELSSKKLEDLFYPSSARLGTKGDLILFDGKHNIFLIKKYFKK